MRTYCIQIKNIKSSWEVFILNGFLLIQCQHTRFYLKVVSCVIKLDGIGSKRQAPSTSYNSPTFVPCASHIVHLQENGRCRLVQPLWHSVIMRKNVYIWNYLFGSSCIFHRDDKGGWRITNQKMTVIIWARKGGGGGKRYYGATPIWVGGESKENQALPPQW
jgi:hypothetical protein